MPSFFIHTDALDIKSSVILATDKNVYANCGFKDLNIYYTGEEKLSGWFHIPIIIPKAVMSNVRNSDLSGNLKLANSNFTSRLIKYEYKIIDENDKYYVVDYAALIKADNKTFKVDFLPSVKGISLSQFAWWSSNWNYRKLITVDHTKVYSTCYNFPMYFNVTDADLKNNVSQTDGGDIAFINWSDDVSQYYHEICSFEKTTGALDCWINLTELSSLSDTKLWMYYGNPSCANQWDVENTWNKSYVLVQHFNESSGASVLDSTSFNNDVSNIYNSPNYHQPGQCGYSVKLDSASKDYMLTPNSVSINFSKTSTFTISTWYNSPNTGAPSDSFAILGKRYASGGAYAGYFFYIQKTSAQFYSIGMRDSTPTFRRVEVGAINFGTWEYASYIADGTTVRLYSNVTQIGSSNTALAGSINTNRGMTFGRYCQDYDGAYFNGYLDEIHISNVIRTPSYIRTCYSNQKTPSAFYSVSTQEAYGNFNIGVGNETPANHAIDQPVSGDWCIDINSTGQPFNWTIEIDGQLSFGNDDTNGTKCLSYNLNCGTNYTVWVNVSIFFDGSIRDTSNTTYWFWTIACTYCPSQTYNLTTNYTITWCVDMVVSNGVFNYTVNCSNGQSFSATGKTNGTYCFVLYNISLNTTHYVWVNLTGTNCWNNRTYTVNLSLSSTSSFIINVNRDRFVLGIAIGSFSFIVMGYVLLRRKKRSIV